MLAALALAVVSLGVGPAEHNEGVRIDRLTVVEAGFYTARKTGEEPAAGTTLGHINALKDIKFLKEAPTVTARLHTGFGVRFRAHGRPNGGKARLHQVWLIPAPGIHNPKNGNTYRQSLSDYTVTVGGVSMRGYSFDEPWEIVKGTWTIQIWQDERKLLEKSFLIE